MKRQQWLASPSCPISHAGTRLGTLCLHTMHLMSRRVSLLKIGFSALKTSRDLLMPACDDKDARTLTGTCCPRPLCPHDVSRGGGGRNNGVASDRTRKTRFGNYRKKTNLGAPLCKHKERPLPLIGNLIKSSLLNCRTVFCSSLNQRRK